VTGKVGEFCYRRPVGTMEHLLFLCQLLEVISTLFYIAVDRSVALNDDFVMHVICDLCGYFTYV